jgi:CPW-WPC domain-containing protein
VKNYFQKKYFISKINDKYIYNMYLYIFIGLIILIILSFRQKKTQGNLQEHLETCQFGQGSATSKGNAFFTNSMFSSFFQRDQPLNQLEANNVITRKQLDDYKTNVLRSNSEYAGLESQYNAFNNNMDNEFRKLHNQLEKNKEKAKQSKQTATAKFNSIDNKMNAMVGSPGDDLESKLKPFVDTAIETNLNKLANTAIEDVARQPGLRNRWSSLGSGNIHNWQIIPGLGCPMRVDPESGNVQCLSYNGRDCEWNYVSQNGQDLSKIDTSRVNPLSCGDDHRRKYGSDGYSSGNHWCRTVYNTLSKNLTEVDWNMCPTGWTRNNASGTSCNAPSDYSGPCARTSGFAGYSDQGKQGWAQSCLARWPFKVNVNSAVSSLGNMNSQVNKNVQGKLGNLVPKSNLNTLIAYNNGVYVKAFKLNTSNNSRGDMIQDGLITTNINFNWGVGLIFGIRENPGITNTDAIYMELIGFIRAPGGASSLKFRLTSDDGSRFFMAENGEISGIKLLVDMWQNGNSQKESSPVNVRANTHMPFVVQYYERDGSANLRLEWSVNNAAYTIIPREAFFINKDICNHQFNFDYIGQANTKAESVIPRITPLIPVFDRNQNDARQVDGDYKVWIYRAYSYPCYNITTNGYINGGAYGSIFDNNDSTGVDMESYYWAGEPYVMPYRIVVFMPAHKTFRGKLRMNLVAPWSGCLPRTMTMNTMSVDQNTINSYVGNPSAQNIIFNQRNIDSSFNNQINLGQIGDQNQVNQNRINQSWDLNITDNPFNIVVFEITSHWGSQGRSGSNSVWITSIQFDTVEAPIVQPKPTNSAFTLIRNNGWLNWSGTPQLLYKASRDGWTVQAFHRLCDIRGPTLTIATTTDGRIVGGFNPLSWNSSNSYQNAPTAFLFDNTDKYITNNGSTFGSGNAIYQAQSYGPTFGGGHDFLSLYGGYGMQMVQGSAYTFLNSQRRGPFSTPAQGGWSVSIRELEVYSLSNPVVQSVIVYEHGNFQGRSLELGVGTYDYNFINSRGFNDQISSMRVAQGLQVEAWEHNPGGGRRWFFQSDTSWVGDANDTISSLIIRRI